MSINSMITAIVLFRGRGYGGRIVVSTVQTQREGARMNFRKLVHMIS